MAARRARASGASDGSSGGGDLTVIAEGVSKQYPGRPAVMFPPVVSLFERDLNPFGRKKRAAERGPARKGKTREREEIDDEDEEEDEEEEDDEGFGGRLPTLRVRPEETFWALKDVSFSVAAGTGLAVLGGPEAGKSTLMRILGRQAVPTEGRALVRDPVSPLPVGLARGINLSGKGTFDADLVFGGRLLGVPGRIAKQHRDEIEELARPLLDEEGDPAPGAIPRLSVAAAAVLPSNVILLEEPFGDPEFASRIVERVRQRLREGSSLVLASRRPEVAAELCDEMIVLRDGLVVDRGPTDSLVSRYEPPESGRAGATGDSGDSGASSVPAGQLWNGRKLRVPPVITPFHGGVAMLAAELRGASGAPLPKRVDAGDELEIEIRLETSVPGAVVHCDVAFTAAKGGDTRVRLELPDPVRFEDPGTHVLVARVRAGVVGNGPHDVRVDALVTNTASRGTSVIGRDAGRVRIVGGELEPVGPDDGPAEHWDGRPAWRVAAGWSVGSG